MKSKLTKKFIIAFILIMIMFSFTSGFFIKSFSNKVVEHTTFTLMNYACHDGCSIATKDDDGFLTNETWGCWDECNVYMKDVWNDYALGKSGQPIN